MLSPIREANIAWAAGFFDGEGSTILGRQRPGKGKPFIRISISQKEREALDKFRNAMRVGKVYGPYGRADQGFAFHYVALGDKAHYALLLMWPHLGELKRFQAEVVISTVEEARGILL